MEKIPMESMKVYSPVLDDDARTNLGNSPIFKKAYTEAEVAEAEKKNPIMYEYTFKFEGLKVVQFSGMKKMAK
jgi:hypothetical protein